MKIWLAAIAASFLLVATATAPASAQTALVEHTDVLEANCPSANQVRVGGAYRACTIRPPGGEVAQTVTIGAPLTCEAFIERAYASPASVGLRAGALQGTMVAGGLYLMEAEPEVAIGVGIIYGLFSGYNRAAEQSDQRRAALVYCQSYGSPQAYANYVAASGRLMPR